LILIFEKKSPSPPSAVKEKLTRRIRITEKQRRKALPPIAFSLYHLLKSCFNGFLSTFPQELFNDVGGNWIDLVLPSAGIDLRKEKKLHEKNLGDHKSLKNAG
jgi:hypothetical protein